MLDLKQLSDPFAYSATRDSAAPAERVEIIQTHISVVCIAGAGVYKLKKPVKLPFLDFSTLAARKQACEDEVRLNRRLCPAIYRGVVELRRGAAGLNFRGDGEIVDYAVHMSRMPAERMLDRLLAENAVTRTDVERLAHQVAAFHVRAERGPRVTAAGDPRRLVDLMRANFDETKPLLDLVFDRTLHARLAALDAADAVTLLPALLRRARDGRVVEGHGDLHARNVCMTDPPAIYDCIEFNEEFRCLDVATENAFMAMDLRYRGHRELADAYVAAYVDASADVEQPALLPPLIRYRALVRAKVAAIASRDAALSASDRDNAAESARRHLRLAAITALEQRGRRFIAACGPPACGKSALLEQLARESGAALFQSDRIRKQLAGVPATEHLPESAYSADWNERTYAELLRRGVNAPGIALLDATWSSRARRVALRNAASACGASVTIVHLDVPAAVIRARIANRAADPHAISDADARVLESFLKTFEAPGTDEHDVVTIRGDHPLSALLDVFLAHALD